MVGTTEMTMKELCQFEVLVDWFSLAAPVRPMDMFNLNFSSAATLVGLVITYMLVLLQFKIGDCEEQ